MSCTIIMPVVFVAVCAAVVAAVYITKSAAPLWALLILGFISCKDCPDTSPTYPPTPQQSPDSKY
jgi:hypothetical protein